MSRQLPDLLSDCYDGEHRKLLAPEQFKQMFCDVCLNPGCRNSKGAGSKWSNRIATQEDRLLNNPAFAPEMTAELMGIPDFKDMIQEALRIEVSTRRNDWEPVTDADIGRAAAEMLGVIPPASFQSPDPNPEPPGPPEPEHKAEDTPEPEEEREVEGKWRVRGDSKDKDGNHRTYTVTLYQEDTWECSCPSRENPCKHVSYIKGRLESSPKPPVRQYEDPVAPPPAPSRQFSPPQNFNTPQPQGGITIGGPIPNPAPEPHDPWEAPKIKERKIGVGGTVTFSRGKNRDK